MEDDFLIVPSGAADSYCRLCLSEVNIESMLVVSNGLTQLNQMLVQLIKRYMGIDLANAPTDSPCGICTTCRMMLEEFERFRERCLRCDYVLTGKARNGGTETRQDLPFQCSECSNKFQFKSDFEKHWKSFHDCPHHCDQCEARFSMQSLLKYHQFRYHREGVVDDLTLSCSHCPRIFADQKQLQFHVQILHGPVDVSTALDIEHLPAEEMDPPAKKSKPNETEASKEKGLKKKPFVCDTCGAQFHFIGSLRHHVSNVHNKVGPKPRKKATPVAPNETSQPAIISTPTTTQLIVSPPEMALIVREPTPQIVDPPFAEPTSSTNMTIVPMYDQDISQLEHEIMPEQVPFTKMEQPEPMPYQETQRFEYPGMYPLAIVLERLDPSLVPPILNYEIPLGKIYYAQQQLMDMGSTADHLDDELLMNYPTFAQKVSKKYICNTCGMEFTNHSSLSRHRQIVHEGIVFSCVDCGKQFQGRHNLERHIIQHTNEFPAPCDECPLKFAQRSTLQAHKERYHVPGAPPLTIDYCPFCNRAFCSISALKNHVRFLHRDKHLDML